MTRDSDQVVALNESLAREVNEAIERGQWPGERDAPASFRCECTRLDCNLLVEVTPSRYEQVRAHPRRFIVAPGHEQPDVETVVETTPSYLVVEKGEGAGAVAEATDPRT
jgi:hypothetical protein